MIEPKAWQVSALRILLASAAVVAPARAADPQECIVDGVHFDDCTDSGIVLGGDVGGGNSGGTPSQLPDFSALGGFTFSPQSIESGESYAASAVLVNLGGIAFSDNLITVAFYLSPLGNDVLAAANFLGSVELTFPRVTSTFPDPTYVAVPFQGTLPASIAGGQYRLAVHIDVDNVCNELNELNNKVAAGPTISVDGDPDLSPLPGSLDPLGTVPQGSTISLRARVRNEGQGRLDGPKSVGVRFRAVPPGGDELGGVTLATTTMVIPQGQSLEPGGSRQTPLVQMAANLAPATYQIALDVDVDDVIAESTHDNNAGFVGTLGVGAASGAKPDLAAKSPKFKTPGDPIVPGNRIATSFQVQNLGAAVGPLPKFKYTIILSADTTFTLSDFEIQTQSSAGTFGLGETLPIPAPGTAVKVALFLDWPVTLPVGTWNVGVLLNPGGTVAESNLSNNTLLLGTVRSAQPCRDYASLEQAYALFDEYYQSQELDILETPGPRGEYCVGTGGIEDDGIFFGALSPTPPADSCHFAAVYERYLYSIALFVLPRMHERCVMELGDIPEESLGGYELLVGTIEDLARGLKDELGAAKKACDRFANLPRFPVKRRYCACPNTAFLNWQTSGPRPGECTYTP